MRLLLRFKSTNKPRRSTKCNASPLWASMSIDIYCNFIYIRNDRSNIGKRCTWPTQISTSEKCEVISNINIFLSQADCSCASLIRSSASFSYVTSIVSNIFKITVDVHSRWCSKWWSVTLCTAPWFICGLERHSKRISTLLPFILLSLFSFFIMTNSTQSSLFFIGTIPTSLSIDVLSYYSRPLFCAYTGLMRVWK